MPQFRSKQTLILAITIGAGVEKSVAEPTGIERSTVAAGRNYAAVVRLLLDRQADANSKLDNGWPVLNWAAKGGDKAIVEMLLTHGAEVDARDNESFTALHTAAEGGHADIVQL